MMRDGRWLGRALPLTFAFALLASRAEAADAGAPSPRANGATVADADATVTENPHAADPHAADPQGSDPHAADPHGHGAAGGGMFRAPEDGVMADPSLPVGTLEIHIVDASGAPLPNLPVTLGVLENSVSKGESRKRLALTTNDRGIARRDQLETGSTIAYRPMVLTEGATFSAMPFRMPETSGMRALLHVYPIEHDLEKALIISQVILYAEVKDDRIQVQQAFRIYNFGKSAWVPRDIVVALPEEFTAFTSQEGMSDVGVEAVPSKGVRLQGTFVPGQHVLEFRWQLPYSGQSELSFDVGMAPRTAASRVIVPASRDMTLSVPGFPTPQSTSDGMGQRTLITEKHVNKDEAALSKITVSIQGLPSEGPGKLIATLLAIGTMGVGIVLGSQTSRKRTSTLERGRLLDELEELELAHRRGDVGPKTYERARREILDALASTFALAAKSISHTKSRARAL